MSWNVKIDPCPFCGSSDGTYVERLTTCAYQVWCNCGARGPTVEEMRFESEYRAAQRAAAKAWNTRSIIPIRSAEQS